VIALFHEVRPETVDIRNVKNQPPPPNTSIAVFEVQNRIPVFCAERCEIGASAAVDDLQSQDIFVEANGCPHVRNPNGNRRNSLNHRCASKGMPVRPAVLLTLSINNGQHTSPARSKTGVIPFLGLTIEKQMMKAS